jgi:hypothetical protein
MTFKEFIELNNYTKEMQDWFIDRTNRHISLVQKYAKKIEQYDGNRFAGLFERSLSHDKSKFEDLEIKPYIFISWCYHCKDLGINYKVSQFIKDQMNIASEHHIHSNQHHPEFYDRSSKINREDRDKTPDKMVNATKMTILDIGEMVSDWLSMSEERQDSIFDWVEKNVNVRWKFTDQQVDLINELTNKFGVEYSLIGNKG